jgi:hypothetical protein
VYAVTAVQRLAHSDHLADDDERWWTQSARDVSDLKERCNNRLLFRRGAA